MHWIRGLTAIFAILIAAVHLPYASLSNSFYSSHASPGTNSTGAYHPTPPQFGAQAMGLWFGIEVIAYTVIAIVYLLGIKRWYIAANAFNIFNITIYFLSGVIAIPGITSMPFSRSLITSSLSTNVLMISWIALLILGLLSLKYDNGSELEHEI